MIRMILTFVLTSTALAGDPEQGRAAAAVCAGCHGADGNSRQDTWPILASQPEAYLAKQLWDFKVGARTDPSMAGIAGGLDATAIADLAAWFSTRPASPPPGPRPDPALVARGEALFQRGAPERALAPCRACHGVRAQGGTDSRGNAFPALAGQHRAYTARQLANFASGERRNDPGGMMSLIATRLTPADIEALAAYLSVLERAQVAAASGVTP